jgi:N-acyl-D-aspartate/D-glutamate deacylase
MTEKINRRTFIKSCAALSAVCLGGLPEHIIASDNSLDIIIKGGTIVDGSGQVSFKADLGIKKNLISAIGDLSLYSAGKTIDATGMIVSPGFIDIHTHYDGTARPDLPDIQTKYPDGIYQERINKILLFQGITTIIGGNCSYSPMDLEKHFKIMKKKGLALNYGLLIGHSSLRKKVIGTSNKVTLLTKNEKDDIERILVRSFNLGALGVSTELENSPASLAGTDEIIYIGKITARYRGMIAIHRRSETEDAVRWTQEAVDICKKAEVPVQISHLRVVGKPYWISNEPVIKVVSEAVGKKLPLRCDFYPYDSAQGTLEYIFPSFAKKGGLLRENLIKDSTLKARVRMHLPKQFSLIPPENIIIFSKVFPDIFGKNLEEAGKIIGKTPVETAIELLLKDEKGHGGPVIYRYAMSQGNYERLMKCNFAIISSDGGIDYDEPEMTHLDPRIYGTFPRLFGTYVRDKKFISMEEAVKRVTGMPARQLGLKDRGLLREKMAADITIFNPETIADMSNYDSPPQYGAGIEYVIIEGKMVVEKGIFNGVKAGKILKR